MRQRWKVPAPALVALLALPALLPAGALSRPAQQWLKAPAAKAPVASALKTAVRVPPVSYTSYTLPNGLRVLMSRDTSAPVVSVAIVYNVGSFVEPKGRTGFAHLFEHMMFQGSANVGKAEHTDLIVSNGGVMNGGTSQDFTVYYEALPANQLPLALFLEGDRMGSLDVSQTNLDNQRQVVQEERRMRYDNQPYGTMYEHLLNAAYTQSPYQHTTIGSMADLNKADLAYVRRFFHTFYAPNNAVLAITGDFDPARARALVQKYFAKIPRGPKPTLPSLYEPPQAKERRVVYTDPLAPLPAWLAGYHIPNGNAADAPALEMLGTILAGGKSSRLWQALVEKQQVCTSVGAGGSAGRGPDLFSLSMNFGAGQDVMKAEKAMDAEIARVQRDGVTAQEMQTARRQSLTDAVSERTTSMSRAQSLAINAVVYGDASRINTHLAKLDAVTAADVQRVAKKYLQTSNRTVVIAMPPAKATS